MLSDPFDSPFGGGNGTPDPQNPFQIVNEERPVGGAVPFPFEAAAEESPFGVAPSNEPKPIAAAPRPGAAPPSGGNPFRTEPKEAAAGAPQEGGFEMTGMKADSTPVGNLDTVPIGGAVEALETLKSCMDGLGFAPAEAIALTCPDGLIEFVSYGNTAMAVLREGDFQPGVRETLIIIARELDQE